jgi:hypothetical protein
MYLIAGYLLASATGKIKKLNGIIHEYAWLDKHPDKDFCQ